MKSIATVEISRPIEEVFRLTNEQTAEWSDVVVRDEVIERTPDWVGSRLKITTAEHGREMIFDGTITAYEPPHRSVISMTGSAFDIVAEYLFEEIDGGTRVTQQSTVNGKGLIWLFFLLFGWALNKQGCDAAQLEMNNLKSYCEASR